MVGNHVAGPMPKHHAACGKGRTRCSGADGPPLGDGLAAASIALSLRRNPSEPSRGARTVSVRGGFADRGAFNPNSEME